MQLELSPALPKVLGNADYQEMERTLGILDEVLRMSRVESEFLALAMGRYLERKNATGAVPCREALERHQQQSRLALRTMVLKSLLGETYRDLSLHLAESALLRRFCGIEGWEVIEVPSKSALQRYAHWLPHEQMRSVVDQLTRAATTPAPGRVDALGLEIALELELVSTDLTCLEAHIHFPVDWVLFRDAIRTLVKAILTIRRHGLKHRIAEPEGFLSQINRLCIEMTQVSRAKQDSKKKRKTVVRRMKRLVNVVAEHAQRYRDILDGEWQKSDLSRPQAEVILKRIDSVLAQVPRIQKQAHERIIAERKVANEEKILSLYEPDIHVIVRGKAGAQVEFGNTLALTEQTDGFIVDYHLSREASKGDSIALKESLERVEKLKGAPVLGVIADRGCESKANRDYLEEKGIYNAMCPRNPRELARRLKEDELFGACQKRRGQTEARVAILKNVFIGETCRAKGFEHRQAQVDWAVLTHNLRLIARMRMAQQRQRPALVAEAA